MRTFHVPANRIRSQKSVDQRRQLHGDSKELFLHENRDREMITVPSGWGDRELDKLLRQQSCLRCLIVERPRESGRWLKNLPRDLKLLDISGEFTTSLRVQDWVCTCTIYIGTYRTPDTLKLKITAYVRTYCFKNGKCIFVGYLLPNVRYNLWIRHSEVFHSSFSQPMLFLGLV